MKDRDQPVFVRELFKEATRAELRQLHADPEEWADDLDDLIASLRAQLERADRQLDEFRADTHARHDHDEATRRCLIEEAKVDGWRRRTNTILERAVNRHRRVLRYAAEATDRRRDEAAARLLRDVLDEIDRHRDDVTTDEPEPCDADRDLWDAADTARAQIANLERIA